MQASSFGWEKCGHGLTSRPLVSFVILLGLGVPYLLAPFTSAIVLLGLFAGPTLGGCLFLVMLLIWLLLMLVLCGELLLRGAGQEVHWVSGSGPGRKRIRLYRKTPAHLAGFMVLSRPWGWKRLRHVRHFRVSIPDPKG